MSVAAMIVLGLLLLVVGVTGGVVLCGRVWWVNICVSCVEGEYMCVAEGISHGRREYILYAGCWYNVKTGELLSREYSSRADILKAIAPRYKKVLENGEYALIDAVRKAKR
jgi:hypothetical protein